MASLADARPRAQISCGALFFVALLVPLLGSGCGLLNWVTNGFKVGPEYVEPETSTAPRWIDYDDPRLKSEEADLGRWWTVLEDPVLDMLVQSVSEQNLTLKAAAERIAGSRARMNVAVGNLFPQEQYAFGGYSYNHLSNETETAIPGSHSFSQWDLGGALAWELDFWGRFRRAIESADAELEASVADYDDLLVILLAEVATNYILYRTYQERLVFVRANVEIQQKSYTLTQDKFRAGAVTERDVQMSKQILDQTRAKIPRLEAGLREASNALCILQGVPPRDLSDMLGKEGKIPGVKPEVAVGIPADLVRRRPDVRRAERLVAAQSARIGVAESDFYPRFSILGTIGVQAETFSGMFSGGPVTGSIGPSFQWNILHYGRILNRVRSEEAGFRELALAYQEAVLRAGKEAEDSITGLFKAQEAAAALAESVTAAARIVQITTDQYQQGAIDFFPLYYFESVLADQEDQQAAARGDIAVNLIRIYRSLGGGWQGRTEGEAQGGTSSEFHGVESAEPAAGPTEGPR